MDPGTNNFPYEVLLLKCFYRALTSTVLTITLYQFILKHTACCRISISFLSICDIGLMREGEKIFKLKTLQFYVFVFEEFLHFSLSFSGRTAHFFEMIACIFSPSMSELALHISLPIFIEKLKYAIVSACEGEY